MLPHHYPSRLLRTNFFPGGGKYPHAFPAHGASARTNTDGTTGSGGGYGGERRAFSSAGGFGSDRGFGKSGLPTQGRRSLTSLPDRGGDRGYAVREELPLPTKPPYTAHLGNLSFDATEGDVHDFFAECEVTNVRIVEDKLERKPKGFGYVEFGSLEGLKKALDLSGTQFQGRNVRVSVAEPRKYR